MINASNEGICVEWVLKKKTKQPWLTYFQIACKYFKSFYINLLNIIFDDFSIWLLGYRIK